MIMVMMMLAMVTMAVCPMMMVVMFVLIFVVIIVMMVVMMLVFILVVIIVIVMVVVMLVLLIVIIVVVMVVVMLVFIFIVIILHRLLYLCDPSCRSCHFVKVKQLGVDKQIQGHITVVTRDDFGLGLKGAKHQSDTFQLFRFHLRGLVEQDDITELDLLDDQILDIILLQILVYEVLSSIKFVLQSQGIHHAHDAIQAQETVLDIVGTHVGDGANGLGNRSRFADTTCLDDNVVKASKCHEVLQLLHEVHLQGTADATVLQGHQAVVLLIYDASFLDEVCINIYFTDIIYDNGKLYTTTIGQDTIQKRSLTAAQITRKQQYRDFRNCHFLISV